MINLEYVLGFLLLFIAFVFMGLSISEAERNKKIKNNAQLLYQQGFIQVKFHDIDVWIKAQDVPSLVE